MIQEKLADFFQDVKDKFNVRLSIENATND